MLMILVKKKWKLGFWVSLLGLIALPFSAVAQNNSTTISAKRLDKKPQELSLSWSVYSNEYIPRDMISKELKLVCEDQNIEITQFQIHIYKSKKPVELIKINGNQLDNYAVTRLKSIHTNEAIAITVLNTKNPDGKFIKFPTFFFFVN